MSRGLRVKGMHVKTCISFPNGVRRCYLAGTQVRNRQERNMEDVVGQGSKR